MPESSTRQDAKATNADATAPNEKSTDRQADRATDRAADRAMEADLPAIVLDNLEPGLIAIGTDGHLLYLNRVALDVLDLRLDDVRGREVADLFSTDDVEWLVPVGDDRVGDPRSHREVTLRVEGSGSTKEVVIESTARVLSDRRGRELGVVVMFTDISDSAEDEEFRRTAERLAHLGELSAVVAHEIRNPLTGIRTTIQFLEKKLDAEHEMRGSIRDVIGELDRIETIITDLLLLARPQRGARELVDMSELVQRAVDSLASHVEEAGVTLKSDLPSDLPTVEADETTVMQVILNLLVNAIDAMEGTAEPTLRVATALRRYRVKRPTVEVSFYDSGTGIAPEVKDRIFDPFFTTKTMGTGLGLPLSLQIMKDHGGTIHVRNRPQGGTIFKLQFPVPDDVEVPSEPKSEPKVDAKADAKIDAKTDRRDEKKDERRESKQPA